MPIKMKAWEVYDLDPEVKRLQQENERLKKIIAKQALEIDFKDELLKKSH